MTHADLVKYLNSAEFERRRQDVNARLERGEPMTYQNTADLLGLSYEIFAVLYGKVIMQDNPDIAAVAIDTSPVRYDS